MTEDIHWQQRFQNFDRAMALLREPFERDILTLSKLEQQGTIQRFDFAVELAWNTLKDFMEHEGRNLHTVTPRNVLKEAFSARILSDGQVWIDMLNHRNQLSHQYDESVFDQAMIAIRDRYLAALNELHGWLQERCVPE
jgi:nucleotidyltransferase substrate binding protein (TIGR01987 family)